jgi:hypothetical protein
VTAEAPNPWDMLGQQISSLRTDLTAQVAALGARLDRLVTTDTHQADIRRLDQAQATERSRVDQQMQSMLGDLGIIRQERVEREAQFTTSMTDLRKSLEAEIRNRQESEKSRDKQRRDDLRWWFGSLVALAGVVVAAIALIQ